VAGNRGSFVSGNKLAPKLSVGLPVYNGERHVRECLDSLLGQSYEDFELIISDNASDDGTGDICRQYAKMDSRIVYVRQAANIGRVPNHNFLIEEASGSLFKWVAADDLYARDLLKRSVEVLDERPEVVLVHSRSAIVDDVGNVTEFVKYPVASDSLRAPDRFRSMLFDGWGDDSYGVIRTDVLRRTPLHGSYHYADRTFSIEIALHGPFYQVPDWLFFRREAPDRVRTVRARCTYLDPRRADRLRHPVARLYGEYVFAYVAMLQRAPLSGAELRECYGHLARWALTRCGPVARRMIRRESLKVPADKSIWASEPEIVLQDLVAGQDRRSLG
jgi:glycosyltransferase involved in cell wall biosynthesis